MSNTPLPRSDPTTVQENPVPPGAQVPTISTPSVGTLPPEAEDLLRDLRLDATGSGATADTGLLTPLSAVPGYELLDELGRGGMGVVYKARQIALDRVVALKMIGTAGRLGQGEAARFLAEAQAVAAVRHPNVVEVYDSGSAGGRPYYAMEYVPGGSLAAYLAGRGPFSPTEAARLLAAVARGVQAAHEAGIVHRDLKPANILLAGFGIQDSGSSPEGRQSSACSLNPESRILTPKVTDFGLAKRRSSDLTGTQAVMGTPAYMAPEQAGGKAKFVGPAADVYALGGVLYECLTGRRPFEDEDSWELIQRVLGEPAPSPRQVAAGVPRDLELVCLKCLAKDPSDRYATAGDLADDLEAYLAGRPVVARPIPAAVRVCRWVRRRPTAAALYAVLAVLLFVVPPVVIWNQGRLETSRVAAAEATRAEEAAKLAQAEAENLAAARKQLADEADNRKAAAEQLAATRELLGLQSAIRQRLSERPPQWTSANRTDLARAAALTTDPRVRTSLRSCAGATLLAPALGPAEPLARGMTAAVVATAANTPDGPVVALGEYKAWGLGGILKCHVWLIDPATGRKVRELTFPAATVSTPDGGLAQGGVRSLAFSPDGTRLYVGTRASRVYRFDLTDRRNTPAQKWTALSSPVEQLAVSRDGRFVFGVCRPELPVLRWDAQSGERSEFFATVHGARAIATDPATGDLVVSDGPFLYRLTAAGSEPVGVPIAHHPRRLAFTPDGRVLFATLSNQVAVLDPATLRETARLIDPDLGLAAHEEVTVALAVHPSGAFLASAPEGIEDRQVKVWELASGRLVGSATVPGTDPISLAWSADGRFLLATGAQLHTLRFALVAPPAARAALHFPYPIRAAAFAPDEQPIRALAEGPHDGPWSLLGGATPVVPVAGGSLLGSQPGVAVAPDTGHVVITRPGAGVRVVRAGTITNLSPLSGRCPRYSPDGSALWAVVDGDSVVTWGTNDGQRRGSWSNAGAKVVSGLSSLDALAVGRSRAVVGGRDGAVHVLSDRAVWQAGFPRPGDPVLSIALSPDEELVAAGTRSGSVRLIQTADRVELPGLGPHPGGAAAVSFNRDGTLLASGGKDRAVRVWQRVGDGFELLFAVDDLPAPVVGLEFGPTGNTLLVLLTNERAVRVWDLDRLRTQLGELTLDW
jgi:WD40 repeat protein